MKVLLDEDLSHELRTLLGEHEVITTWYMGWSGVKNGALLAAAENHGFEVFVTGDKNVSHQQNLSGRKLAIVELSAHNWPIIRNHVPAIRAAVDAATVGSYQFVECGRFRR